MAQSQQERPFLRIGSRGSPLALAQAREVKQRLVAASGLDGERIEIKVIRTTGDVIALSPALIIEQTHIDELIGILSQTLQ